MKKGKVMIGAAALYFIAAMGIYCVKMEAGSNPEGSAMGRGSEEALRETELTEDCGTAEHNDQGMDILSRHLLPGLERMDEEDAEQYVNKLQVIRKIRQLGLDTEDFLNPEISVSGIESAVRGEDGIFCDHNKKVEFEGATSQELQEVIDNNPGTVIEIVSKQIRVTETIVLQDHTMIDGNGARFLAEGVTYGFTARNVSQICLNNMILEGESDYGMYFVDCDRFSISQNTIEGCLQQAIGIAGDVSEGLIEDNTIIENGGGSDQPAGIALMEMSGCPHNIIIRNNKITNNLSAGIDIDGAYMCYILNNTVSQNDKEGIRLYHEAIGCYLRGNTLEENGGSDSDNVGLAGISLDHAAYNILENNKIANNYGGGVRMNEAAVRNIVMGNIVRDNNMGKNDVFSFYGIALGQEAQGMEAEGADYENIICKNIISGKHAAGIFLGKDCYINDVFDNVIMDSAAYGIEAVSGKFNSILNNITNCGVYNEFQ